VPDIQRLMAYFSIPYVRVGCQAENSTILLTNSASGIGQLFKRKAPPAYAGEANLTSKQKTIF